MNLSRLAAPAERGRMRHFDRRITVDPEQCGGPRPNRRRHAAAPASPANSTATAAAGSGTGVTFSTRLLPLRASAKFAGPVYSDVSRVIPLSGLLPLPSTWTGDVAAVAIV